VCICTIEQFTRRIPPAYSAVPGAWVGGRVAMSASRGGRDVWYNQKLQTPVP
jgi:hypothetical protein